MRVFQINDHLISFYDGRPAQAPRRPDTHNWVDYGALDVGVSTYVIRRGDRALVVQDRSDGLAAAVRKWEFDKPQSGGKLSVAYPFVFKPIAVSP